MRKIRNTKKEKKKLYTLIGFLLTISLGLGYAILNDKLTINSTLNYGAITWDVGFSSAFDGDGTIVATPTISEDKRSITVSCDVGTSLNPETCIVNATITNNSTFNILLSSDLKIEYEDTYVDTVDVIWTSTSEPIKAEDTILKGDSQQLKITIKSRELTSDMLPPAPLAIPITITMNWAQAPDDGTIITGYDFGWISGTILNDGSIQEKENSGVTLNNYYTPITYFKTLKLNLKENVMFKIVVYDEFGNFVSTDGWKSKEATTWTTGGTNSILIKGQYVRIAIADTVLNEEEEYTLKASDYNERYSYEIIKPAYRLGTEFTSINTINLPDVEGRTAGTGFTITGLTYSSSDNTFYAGNYGKTYTTDTTVKNTIVHLSNDMKTNLGEIDLNTIYPDLKDVQGVTIDTSDDTIWFVSPSDKKIYHITKTGENIESISLSLSNPTGIAYDSRTDTLWVLSDTSLVNLNTDGTTNKTITLDIADVDQIYLDIEEDAIYITAGVDYSGNSYVYKVKLTSQTYGLMYTLTDSYAIEGIYIKNGKMYIGNDGLYHDAQIKKNIIQTYLVK